MPSILDVRASLIARSRFMLLRMIWFFVTNNRKDFLAIYRRMELHPGLIVIVPSVSYTAQQDLFAAVVERLRSQPDLTSSLVEIDVSGEIILSELPPSLSNTPEI